MDTVAVTDHGNMFGAVDLYSEAKAHGVKLIFGCETYVAATDRHDKTEPPQLPPHPAREERRRLQEPLVPELDGLPRGLLLQPAHRQAAPARAQRGPDRAVGVPRRRGRADAREERASRRPRRSRASTQDMFGKGNFFLELMPNGLAGAGQLNGELIADGARRLGIPLVATNDCHYVNRSDAARARGPDGDPAGQDASRTRSGCKHRIDSYYIKSPAEMDAYFKRRPRGAREHRRDRASCATSSSSSARRYLPNYKVPDGDDRSTAYLEQDRRARGSSGASSEVARARRASSTATCTASALALELGVIQKMGFSGYFLIVWDFINWAKEHGIPVGPGPRLGRRLAGRVRAAHHRHRSDRVQAAVRALPEPRARVDAGLRRRLLHEPARRGHQVRHRTSTARTTSARSSTLHQLKARGVHPRHRARDGASRSPRPTSSPSSCPSRSQGKTPPIARGDRAGAASSRQLYDESPTVPRAARHREALEGLNRHAGMHAAGVVIAEKPLWEYVPCFRGQNDEIVTQFAMKEVEKAGPGQVRLPRPQDAHRHPDRGATSINQRARRARRAAARHRRASRSTTPTSTR